MSIKDLHKYLDTLTPSVRGNLEIITPKDIGQDFFLHISPSKMDKKFYYPRIGPSQANNEDRTVPRVTVASTLFGCYIGYGRLSHSVSNYMHQNAYHTDRSRQPAVYIHELPFEFALKPTKKLVYDADVTDEHWLVSYNPDTCEYASSITGKLFVKRLCTIPVSGGKSQLYLDIYAEINNKKGLQFRKDQWLTPGHHLLTEVPGEENKDLLRKKIIIETVDKAEFIREKKGSIALLSDSMLRSLKPW